MADSVNPASLPAGMDAYLGYVDGAWPDYQAIAAQERVPCFGLSVIGNPSVRGAGGGDFEPGNAGIASIAGDVRGLHAIGVLRPIVYVPMTWAAAAVTTLTGAGIARPTYRLLTAHYAIRNSQPWSHICGPASCGCAFDADGTQWVDWGPWDESLLLDSFLGLPGSITAPEGIHVPNLNRPIIAVVARPQGGYWQVAQDGGIANFGGAPQLVADDGKLPALLAAGHLITDAAATPSGNGLWLTGSDGAIFTTGDAPYDGSWSQGAGASTQPLQA